MTKDSHSMKPLYAKLKEQGFNPTYVKTLLPDWWDDKIASSPSGYQQAGLRLAKLFGVQPSSLLNTADELKFLVGERRFKRSSNTDEVDLHQACALASTAAKLALKGFDRPTPSNWPSALEIRKALLDRGLPWIDFRSLLDFCWELGVPVVFLSHLPRGAKKMQGLALSVGNRPAIVLTSNKKNGFLVFDLAHELGHIALGHVAANSLFIDETIDSKSADEDERAANRFALEVLTGEPDCKVQSSKTRYITQGVLADAAMDLGRKHQIDPLHVALNYGHSAKSFATGVAAVNLISLQMALPTDQSACREAALRYLDADALGDEEAEVFRKLIGVSDV